tara:strand:+ start:566 stop:694 length:129 start_codon:yes stop_codon:yes gene_type:complete
MVQIRFPLIKWLNNEASYKYKNGNSIISSTGNSGKGSFDLKV